MVFKRVIKSIKRILKPVVNIYRDIYAQYYLKKINEQKHHADEPIKVAFIVHEPESWDKLQPVYEEMLNRQNINPKLIVVPSFDNKLSLVKEYGYEKEFFENKYGEVLLAYDEYGKIINLKSYGFEYVFYQDPYNTHYPKEINSNRVVRLAKICYVPYGYTISTNFSDLLTENKSFFRNVSIFFADNNSDKVVISKVFGKNYYKGIQKVVCNGYPPLEEYANWERKDVITTITWAPRWSYDIRYGGSHFIEYKDKLIELKEKYKEININIRPHPMLFANMVDSGKMSQNEVSNYMEILNRWHINIKDKCPIYEVLYDTDLLISDISSIIPIYFMTGRPIIYCKSNLSTNAEFDEMLKGIYVADTWDEIQTYVDKLLVGEDPLKEIRLDIINNGLLSVHRGAKDKIINTLIFERNI